MRTCVAFASFLLLLLATTAHGIRLDKQLQEAINKKHQVYQTSGEASVARSVNKHCSPDDGHCSSATGTTMKQTTPAVVDAKGSEVMIVAYAAPIRSFDAGTTKKTLTHDESGAVKHMQIPTGNNGHHTTKTVDSNATKPQGRNEAEAASHGPWQQRQTYPDIMDLAGMDYSPATRRSPIHN
ncbi:hypothetical protein PR202_ga18838 [Eleusine coracana subsp. coracana]|uniref:Uncharacterized protein n=1 Tax=Eleusine coracana subsp. coracana TaxID=191504 RepID=A0AAV5CTZ7_ELECO|nr:hypothetical protein PR202_ga18838 [Eleusine coracana subsp. coracana]